jgi:hypothetical protein
MAFTKYFGEIPSASGSAGRDYWNAYRLRD